jgi:hypothetical protein
MKHKNLLITSLLTFLLTSAAWRTALGYRERQTEEYVRKLRQATNERKELRGLKVRRTVYYRGGFLRALGLGGAVAVSGSVDFKSDLNLLAVQLESLEKEEHFFTTELVFNIRIRSEESGEVTHE